MARHVVIKATAKTQQQLYVDTCAGFAAGPYLEREDRMEFKNAWAAYSTECRSQPMLDTEAAPVLVVGCFLCLFVASTAVNRTRADRSDYGVMMV